MYMEPRCTQCVLDKGLKACPKDVEEAVAEQYRQTVRRLVAEGAAQNQCGPQLALAVEKAKEAFFGPDEAIVQAKQKFNALMSSMEAALDREICEAEDPFLLALQLALRGNYIDSTAVEHVTEKQLLALLRSARENVLDKEAVEALRAELLSARRLVFFTDNSGEIVLDKLLMRQIRRMHPALDITAVVRAARVADDADLEDAAQTGLAAEFAVLPGPRTAGVVPGLLPPEAAQAAEQADVLIAKGQGNYEGMWGCGWNVYYLVLCKCDLFTGRFRVPRYTGVIARERTVGTR